MIAATVRPFMRPNDENGHLPTAERPFRVLVIAGSNRRQFSCPGVDSKARALMLRMADRLPQDWEIDYEDIGNVYLRERIQPCNGCVSTAAALCVWPCNCYEPDNKAEPDLMWNLRLYDRLDLADAWAIIGPINWYAPSSALKLMFDRLVCMSGGNPDETLIAHKDPERAMALEREPRWKSLSRNHLEGRTAGFFCYGDRGADEMGADGRPTKLHHKAWFDPEAEPFANERDAYAPLVWQCRFSGIEVPDELWAHADTGVGRPYSLDQAEHMIEDDAFLAAFDAWCDRFKAFVATKGKVEPTPYRAFGREPPEHRLSEHARLGWRVFRMGIGLPPKGSSPDRQQRLGLNRDATLETRKSEGEKLRE